MNTAYLPAIAALAGSAIGGLTSLSAAWLTQRRQASATGLANETRRRQKLYKQVINEASKLYADALSHNQSEVSKLISVYALISRMRVISSPIVVDKAETVIRMIVDAYFAPNKTFPELRAMMESPAMDPLRTFSDACREELQALKQP